ncbi:hypothetical protein EG329_003473 [Mollisiaceae sp. DMI_Dod_QoI]|nr:hypothetical protein EG329_003473 [Helotiales sp. DMI_Dod_QoI]
MTRTEPDPDLKAKFSDTPWAIKLFEDPTLKPFVNDSRIVKSHTGDTFCARTLATEDTIAAWQSFYRLPSTPSSATQSSSSSSSPTSTSSSSDKNVEILSILKLGSGVNGHRDICHGGFVSLLLDEVLGSIAESQRVGDQSTMTAYLKVDYKAPVRTPGTVLCRAWLEKREGRKMWIKGTVEDGRGQALALGDALFVIVEGERVGKVGKAKI